MAEKRKATKSSRAKREPQDFAEQEVRALESHAAKLREQWQGTTPPTYTPPPPAYTAYPPYAAHPTAPPASSAAPTPLVTPPLTFLRPDAANLFKASNPVERQNSIPYLQKQSNEAEQEALCACQTPCTGDEKHQAWCYMNSDAVDRLRKMGMAHACPLRINGQIQPEDPARRVQAAGNGDFVRGCDARMDAGVAQMNERARNACARVDALLPRLQNEQALVPLLMIEFNLTVDEALALENTQTLSPRERLLSAALYDFMVRFVQDSRAGSVIRLLQTPALVEQWKARLARFNNNSQIRLESSVPLSVSNPPTKSENKVHATVSDAIIAQTQKFGLSLV